MMSAGGMNAGMMNMNRSDVGVFARNDSHLEALPLAADFFPKVRLSAATRNEYEHVASALLDNALDRVRKERIYGGIDESWRDIGAMHGYKRYTKVEGRASHYRIQGVVRAPMTNVMGLLYAERSSAITGRRNVFYGNALDGQTLHVLRERTSQDRHQHLTLRWEASHITTAIDNTKLDACYLEYTGITLDQDRSPVGFKIAHTMDLPECQQLLKTHGLNRVEGTEIMMLQPTSNNTYTEFTLEGSFEINDRLPSSAVNAFLTLISQQLSRLPMEIQSRRLAAMKIIDKTMWVPTNERKNCSVCLSKFGVLGKKHHCRACGEVMCKSCVVARPGREDCKFCKKCVVVACAEDELVLGDRGGNPLHTPSSAYSSSSSSSRHHREARDSYASSLTHQSDSDASVYLPQAQPVPVMASSYHQQQQQQQHGYHHQPHVVKPAYTGYSRPQQQHQQQQHHDPRYMDELKQFRDNNSMTASETSFGSSTFSSGGYIENGSISHDINTNDSYYGRPEGSMIYLDTKSMIRANSSNSLASDDATPSQAGSGRGYARPPPQPFQDVESSLAHQRHLLNEMMHQANRAYRPNPQPVKNNF